MLNVINDEFMLLKKILYSEEWPKAVNENLICNPNSEKDKIERGRNIIELMIKEDLDNLKVLDFGCGEGQLAFISNEYKTNISVGYDITSYKQWEQYHESNVIMTNDWEKVIANGPYDIIILFDVIDHSTTESPIKILQKIKNVLHQNGKIYMRCHPWISRHATHLYNDLNKAWVHLVFSPEEIKQLIPKPKYIEENIYITRPIKTYYDYITTANLKINNTREITTIVEPFFKNKLIASRIIKNTNLESLPEFQMTFQFLDYILVYN